MLGLEVVEGGVRCAIEDSSRGFDFTRQVGAQQSLLDAPAPSERGRGLLMLVSCAEDLAFQQASGDARQQIAFTVRAPGDEVFASLFRPEDFAFDFPDVSGLHGDGSSEIALPVQPSDPGDLQSS